jgi:chloramphenicol 3-O-phosphotransferase
MLRETDMIIFVCGTSSSGKTSVCQALKQKLPDAWLLFSTEGYLGMLGDKFNNLHPANFEVEVPNEVAYAKKHDDGSFEIVVGSLVQSLFATIPDAIGLLARRGFDIVADSLITKKSEVDHFRMALDRFDCKFIYLSTSEKEISRREENRGDRLKGSAVHWLRAFDFQNDCDLIVDTEKIGANQIAAAIIKCLNLLDKKL